MFSIRVHAGKRMQESYSAETTTALSLYTRKVAWCLGDGVAATAGILALPRAHPTSTAKAAAADERRWRM